MSDQPPAETETIRAKLQQYGFSETAAETYLAVVERGSATASTVAEAAGVSTSYVYDVCDDLAADGFVAVDDHRTPTEIRAVPPAEAFGALRTDLDALESAVTARYERPADDEETFEVVKSRATIGKRLVSHIDAAESEVILQLPARRLPVVADALRRARERGVLVLLTLGAGEGDESKSDLDRVSEMGGRLDGLANVVRSGLAGAPSLLATDQERGFVSPATMLSWDHDQTRAITFRQDAVASVLVGSYLGNYWPMGEELLVTRPPSLPATYEMFRHTVFAAELQMRTGTDVSVDLYARRVGTDDPFETVTGTVVDARQNLVEPGNSDFGFENSLIVDTGTERISVGGYGAFLEDFECKQATVRPA
ncbi:TrmB family transcriptional regulator [Haloarcula nitratireducens]|uniref:Transcriptional regulator n=1 Tax=Haloarcula nitratireducens TaxID=2487749 RepID=A0AAW4P6Z4_9EURY|nr:TrmB family transcriptional regulator sugar-binding domain-containing protein [Halomicroarcula nitratireducens]MBX0293523.1 transcriptional regulator [Halomicroarcula nitratireducens]